MAWLNHPDNSKGMTVKDWTLLVTLVDFERPGELGSFINEDSLQHLEEEMSKQGYLDGSQMGNTMRTQHPHCVAHLALFRQQLSLRKTTPAD